jgi:hypothetical protein
LAQAGLIRCTKPVAVSVGKNNRRLRWSLDQATPDTIMPSFLSRRFMAPAAERSLELPPHASLSLHMPAGAQLVCVAGSLHVQAPFEWISETLVTPTQALDEGGHCLLTQTGWATLCAGRAGARLQVLVPASTLSRIVWSARAAVRALQTSWPRGASARRSPQPQ